jgi:acetyltransferase-like isoleucine patch superfamily enzyme
MARDPRATLRGRFTRLVQTGFWGMDIHPSARIENTALIDRTWPRGVHIGEDVYIGHEAVLLTHDFTRGLYLHTTVGARTHIGPRAIILPGINIGADCLVHPGALVIRDMPDGSQALGNPAVVSVRAPRGEGEPTGTATAGAHEPVVTPANP